MWDISIGAIFALVLALLSLGLWLNSRRQLHRLRREILRAQQRQEIERIVMSPPTLPPVKRSSQHIRRVKVVAPFVAAGAWIHDHPGPAVAVASTAAVLAILTPAAVPHETTRPPYASPEPAAPLTSPPAPTGEVEPPAAPEPEPPIPPPEPDVPGEPAAPGTTSGMQHDIAVADARDTQPGSAPEQPPSGDTDQGSDDDGNDEQPDENGPPAHCLQLAPLPVADINACVATVTELVEDIRP